MRRTIAGVVCTAAVGAALVLSPAGPVLLAAAAPCAGALGQFGWQCDTVESAGDVGSASRFAYGLDGVVHVGYSAYVQNRGINAAYALKYARRDAGGAWTSEVVDGTTGGVQSLILNPVTGRPAIGYGCIKFAEFTGTTWSVQTVVKDCGQSASSFAFDSAGTLYAAFSDKRTWRLNIGTRMSGSWSFQTLTPQATWMSMAIAPDGLPSVAFENRAKALVYAHQQVGGTWQFTTLDTASTLIARITLRFSAGGATAVSYMKDDTVRLATRDAVTGTWTVETVYTKATSTTVLDGVSIGYAGEDPVVTYDARESATGLMVLIAARPAAGGGWIQSSVDVVPTSSLGTTETAYNPATGLVGISYGPQGTWKDLKFAEGPPAAIAQ